MNFKVKPNVPLKFAGVINDFLNGHTKDPLSEVSKVVEEPSIPVDGVSLDGSLHADSCIKQ